jgi:succinoglycan biosynthesis transport protein ExoP
MLNPRAHGGDGEGIIHLSPLPRARTVADPGDITFLLGVVRRNWRLIATVGVAGVLVGGLYFLLATPLYSTSSRILIDFRRLSAVGDNDLLINFKVNDAAVDSQTTIIESEGLMRAVIERFGLQNDPEFIGTARWWKSILGLAGLVRDPASMTENEKIQTALETFAKRLKAQRVGVSYVLEASFKSQDAAKAARIADEVAAAYVRDQLTAKQDVASGANDWFSNRIQVLNDQVSRAQNAAVAYRKSNQVMLAVGKYVDEQQVVDISGRLTGARNDRANAESKLARIREVLSGNKLDGGVSDELQNQVIVDLRKKYFELARAVAENTSRYGENHDAVTRDRASMKEMEKAISNEFQRIAQGYRSDAEVAKSREESLIREMDNLSARSADAQKARIEMTQLDSVVQNFQTIRDNFLSRYAELSQEQSFPITEARVLNKAGLPERPYSPRVSISLAGGAGLGLMLGFLAALCIEIFSRRARKRESVETVTGAPCLAHLPGLDGARKWPRVLAALRAGAAQAFHERADRDSPARGVGAALQAARRRITGLFWKAWQNAGRRWPAMAPPPIGARQPDHLQAAAAQPFGIFAEGLRSIKIAADARFEGRRGAVLAFVSAQPGEGCSTVAANFAAIAAGAGQKTVLIDVDLRRSSLTRRMAPSAQIGLQTVCRDFSRLLKAFTLLKSGVHFLPAVGGDPHIHPSELVASDEMRQLLDLLARTFDLIVLDLPPMISVIDSRAIANLVDGYILVVEWNRTSLEALGDAMAENPQVARKLIGFAFNKVDLNEAKRIGDYAAVIDREYRDSESLPASAAQRTA